MSRRWITRSRGEFLDQLEQAAAARERGPAEYARRVADALHVAAWNSTYTAGRGPAVPCSTAAREREEVLLDALDADPPGSWWSRGAELARPRRIVAGDPPREDWLAVPLRRDGPAVTTGDLGRAAAVGLVIGEDGPTWEQDLVQTLTPPPIATKLLEVRTPADWLRLVETWPGPASEATDEILSRHTGLDGRWLVPRWTAVAEEWDAVHLSIGAWARTAGVVQPVGEGSAWTLCAGWDPDATFWLTAQPTVASEQVLPTLTPEEALDGHAG